MESEITDAVILMAGSGSRLRASGEDLPKPLIPICDRPLISYLIEALEKAGVKNLHVVVGAHGRDLPEQIRPLLPSSMQLKGILNPESHKQNGLSVLCAAGHVTEPFLLLMGDHLFEFALLDRLITGSNPGFLNLAIDRKVKTIFDLDDAMKVQTKENLVFAIGKDLASYDAIDTGVFLCPNDFFDYLRGARKDGDCSLADGVRAMAADGRVRGVDIGPAWWKDVDTQAMRARAEEELARRLSVRSNAPSLR
jgi:choline kinase